MFFQINSYTLLVVLFICFNASGEEPGSIATRFPSVYDSEELLFAGRNPEAFHSIESEIGKIVVVMSTTGFGIVKAMYGIYIHEAKSGKYYLRAFAKTNSMRVSCSLDVDEDRLRILNSAGEPLADYYLKSLSDNYKLYNY